ncbi:alpha/beta fold hydrolase [Parafrankia discariae]|uniref:alpha/beta fold hydrolase n=1 Tax=Parafrankia discariae TaxID=365528 RepID=UPI001E31905B|nr:alpha/beta hydrolase [Parafrankia discariae]
MGDGTGVGDGTGTGGNTPAGVGAPAGGEPVMVSKWADLDGPVHYTEFGAPGTTVGSPPVVCVHGLGGSYTNWLALAPLLASTSRVLAPDLAGHGRTPLGGRGADVAANRLLLDRFLGEVVGEPVILVGNSMGGLIGMLQAVHRPESVRGLVLLDPALPLRRGDWPEPLVVASFATVILPGLGAWALARRRARVGPAGTVAQTLRLCATDPARIPASAVEALVDIGHERAGMDGVERAYVAAARSVVGRVVRGGPLRRLIRQVDVPTLLVHGSDDRLVPVALARQVAGLRPDWRLAVVPGCGHLPQLEDAAGTAELLTGWWEHTRDAAAAAGASGGVRGALA